MCYPLVIMAVAAAVSAYGVAQQAKAQKDTADYQSQVAEGNAKVSAIQSRMAIEDGAKAEQNQRLKNAALFGDQRASMAASGMDLGEGSANEILTSTKFMGERDALTIRDNAARRAWGFEVQGQNQGNNAGFYATAASNINPGMAGATSLLSSAASMYGAKGMSAPGGASAGGGVSMTQYNGMASNYSVD